MSFYERQVERAVGRARPLLAPDEEVRGAALAQRRVRPLYPLLMLGFGAGIFVPGITSPDSALPEAVRLFVGLPLFVAGVALMALAGQAVVIVTGAAVYAVSHAALPGRDARILAGTPLAEARMDPARGVLSVGAERLWPLPGRGSSMRELAALLPGGDAAAPPPSRGRRLLTRGALALGVLLAALVVIGVVTKTDEEQIEATVAGYNDALFEGDGEAACAELTARAAEQVVGVATAAVGRAPDPPDCPTAVEALFALPGGAVPRFDPDAVFEVDIRGDRATARAGAPFAYQTLPLVADDGDWLIADLRRPWTVRDAPASDPPQTAEFALRTQAVCANVARHAVPVSSRLLGAPDAEAVDPVEPIRTLARFNRELADRLAALTPPSGDAVELDPVLEALRNVARTRDAIADGFETGDESAVRRGSRRFDAARRRLAAAARAAGLGAPLAACL